MAPVMGAKDRSHGCSKFQGCYFARPLAPAQAEELLRPAVLG